MPNTQKYLTFEYLDELETIIEHILGGDQELRSVLLGKPVYTKKLMQVEL